LTLLKRPKGNYGNKRAILTAKEQFDEMIEVIRQAATVSRMINEVEGDIETTVQNRTSDSSGIC